VILAESWINSITVISLMQYWFGCHKSAITNSDEYGCIYINFGVLRLTEGVHAKHPKEGKAARINIYAPIFISYLKSDLWHPHQYYEIKKTQKHQYCDVFGFLFVFITYILLTSFYVTVFLKYLTEQLIADSQLHIPFILLRCASRL
jgi:hypothetical protein